LKAFLDNSAAGFLNGGLGAGRHQAIFNG